MIPQRLNLIFCLSMTLFILCAGCASKPVEQEQQVETVTEVPTAYAYPGAVYEAGDEAYPAGYYIHTVEFPDESISIIAKWFTGDMMKWEVLASCNPTIDPNRIFLGNTIKIPRDIMTTHTPMTLEFVKESQPKPRRRQTKSHPQVGTQPVQAETTPATVQPVPEPVMDDEPLPFGPKGYTND